MTTWLKILLLIELLTAASHLLSVVLSIFRGTAIKVAILGHYADIQLEEISPVIKVIPNINENTDQQ